MKTPAIGTNNVMVRVVGTVIQHAQFLRGEDGSALVVRDGFASIHEHGRDAWREAFAELVESGFVHLDDAVQSGLVPPGWAPEHAPAGPVVALPISRGE